MFTSVQTFNGPDPVTTRLRNSLSTGFEVTMDEEEAIRDGGHLTETIGWIAIERGSGQTSDNRMVSVFTSSSNHIPAYLQSA